MPACPTTLEPASLFITCLPPKIVKHPSRQGMQPRLWSYIGGIARTNKMKALAVGGVADHCHVLLSLPPTIAIARAVQLIKSGSSKWMHKNGQRKFDWQQGYGGFTIGMSQIPATFRYITNQPRHHAKVSFEDEWKAILDKHGLAEWFSRP